jgi:hypothetical protein
MFRGCHTFLPRFYLFDVCNVAVNLSLHYAAAGGNKFLGLALIEKGADDNLEHSITPAR